MKKLDKYLGIIIDIILFSRYTVESSWGAVTLNNLIPFHITENLHEDIYVDACPRHKPNGQPEGVRGNYRCRGCKPLESSL